MLEQWIKQIAEILLKPSPHVLISIFLTSLTITWSPFGLREKLGLEDIYKNFQFVFSLLLIYSSFFILCYSSKPVLDRICSKIKTKKLKEEFRRKFTQLPKDEILLLRYMNSLPVDVAWIPMEYPAMISLLNKGLICYATNVATLKGSFGNSCQCFAYSINPILQECMNESEVLPHVQMEKVDSRHLDAFQEKN